MLKTNHGACMGAVDTGLSTTGIAILGRASSSMPPADLTLPELDPRIRYIGPAHFYWNADGYMLMSAQNEWPLEYINGIPVGRHEPEPESTNYQGQSQTDSINGSDYVTSQNFTAGQSSGPNNAPVSLFSPERNKCALYDNAAARWLVREFKPDDTDYYSRVIMTGETSEDSQLRTYIARRNPASYCYALSQIVPAGNVVASLYRAVNSAGVAAGIVQVESGQLATSPIITVAGVIATRPAASVEIDTSQASSIVVKYSDGTSDKYSTPEEIFILPFCQKSWGARYVQRIEFK